MKKEHSVALCDYSKCRKPAVTRALCDGHYRQVLQGRPLAPLGTTSRRPKDVKTRILSKVRKSRSNGCWIWQGSRTSNGYGQIYVSGRIKVVHRVAYQEWVGEIGEDTVHHKCARRLCVNPEHLQRVTLRENIAEMHARKSLERTVSSLQKENSRLKREVSRLKKQAAS